LLLKGSNQAHKDTLLHSRQFTELLESFLRQPRPQGPSADALMALATLGHNPGAEAVEELLRGIGDPLSLDMSLASDVAWCLEKLGETQRSEYSLLSERCQVLPFRVFHQLCPEVSFKGLREEVNFSRDIIELHEQTGTKTVEESRLTAWQSSSGLPFEYSGKIMPGDPLTPLVASIRDRLAAEQGVFYDGVLLNLYEHGKCGMRFHSDPGVGEAWSEHTTVVSVGATRRFILRSIADHSQRHGYWVENGDCVYMFGNCQRDYQHCVKVLPGFN
ncbi:unnamed protein product, partial [Chrysoparadoxa australica]